MDKRRFRPIGSGGRVFLPSPAAGQRALVGASGWVFEFGATQVPTPEGGEMCTVSGGLGSGRRRNSQEQEALDSGPCSVPIPAVMWAVCLPCPHQRDSIVSRAGEGISSQAAWVPMLAPPVSHETLTRGPGLSVPLPHLWNGDFPPHQGVEGQGLDARHGVCAEHSWTLCGSCVFP